MTKYFEYNHEDGIPGNSLPDTTDGPYYFEWNDPGTYQSDAIRGVIAQLQTTYGLIAYAVQIYNPSGTYGSAFSLLAYGGPAITLVAGTTYYFGGFFRFEEIDNAAIWHIWQEFDKLIELTGAGFRWFVDSGFGACCAAIEHKNTFTASVSGTTVPSWDKGDHLVPNISPYAFDNPPYCDMSRWYSVVLGVTAQANSSGRVRLWVNGVLTTDYSGQTMETGANFQYMELNGTISQGGSDCPAHKRQFDNIVLTTDWADITAAGLDSDPEEGSASLSLTGVKIIGGSVR